MLVTQRYPNYFDGVIAGDPAMRTGYSNLADAWVTVQLNQIAPKDDAGKPVSGRALSDSDKKLVINSILEQCDAADGIKDGMIFKTKCRFDPAVLTCKGAKTDACLTPAQVNAIQKGFAGPKNARGVNVYPGFPFDTGIAASGGGIPGLLNPGPSPVGRPNTSLAMDVDEAAAAIAAMPRTALTDTMSTELSTFSGHGGKLIFYHGLSDPWFSPLDTLGYYQRLGNDVSSWSRIYLVPGMGHCQGGHHSTISTRSRQSSTGWKKAWRPNPSLRPAGHFPDAADRCAPGRNTRTTKVRAIPKTRGISSAGSRGRAAQAALRGYNPRVRNGSAPGYFVMSRARLDMPSSQLLQPESMP